VIWEKNTSKVRCFPNWVKERLWEEREHICWICNQKILHKGDAEVDHITPFSKWWETVYENAQLVHWRCNQQKWNRVD
jgi:5-methylcytosine-specific restriction endonuclease McrA